MSGVFETHEMICNFLTVFGDNWKKTLCSCKWIFRFDIRWKQTNSNRWIAAGGRCLFCVGTTSSQTPNFCRIRWQCRCWSKWESVESNAVSVDAGKITLESITGYVSIITSLTGVHVFGAQSSVNGFDRNGCVRCVLVPSTTLWRRQSLMEWWVLCQSLVAIASQIGY